MRKIELLVPASSLEVLKIAVIFGADAVYIGGEANGCPHLQNTLRPVYSQKHFYKALHFSPDDRHPLPDGILLQFFKKRCISHIQ